MWVQKCDQKDEMPARPGVAGVWTLTQGQDGQKSWRRAEEGGRRGHGPGPAHARQKASCLGAEPRQSEGRRCSCSFAGGLDPRVPFP